MAIGNVWEIWHEFWYALYAYIDWCQYQQIFQLHTFLKVSKKSGINRPLTLGQYMHYALANYLENDTLAML